MKLKATLFVLLIAISASFGQVAVYDTVSIDSIQYVPDPATNDLSPLLGDTVVVPITVCTDPRSISAGARWSYLASTEHSTRKTEDQTAGTLNRDVRHCSYHVSDIR